MITRDRRRQRAIVPERPPKNEVTLHEPWLYLSLRSSVRLSASPFLCFSVPPSLCLSLTSTFASLRRLALRLSISLLSFLGYLSVPLALYCLSITLFLCLSFYLRPHLSLYHTPCLSVSLSLFLEYSPSIYLSIFLFLSLSPSVSFLLSRSQYLSISPRLSISLFNFLSHRPSFCIIYLYINNCSQGTPVVNP